MLRSFKAIPMSDGVDFIKHTDAIEDVMIELNIRHIVTGIETVSSIIDINERSPDHRSYLLAEQTRRYLNAVVKDTDSILSEYKDDLSLPYIHKASYDTMVIRGSQAVQDATVLDMQGSQGAQAIHLSKFQSASTIRSSI